MKKNAIILLVFFANIIYGQNTFDFVIETSLGQTDYKFVVDAAVDFHVDWGDGSEIEIFNGDVKPHHYYGEAAEWTIKVFGEAERIKFFSGIYFCDYVSMLRDILTPITEGVTGINNASEMFREITVESFTCTDFFDDVSVNVTNMSFMFKDASSFNHDISGWDVSNVTDMSEMFHSAASFNQDIGGWDVSNVTTVFKMFHGASSFNQDIGVWDVSGVTNMDNMFSIASSFNQDIGGWDVSNVETMKGMFWRASVFSQDIGGWDVSNVINMRNMFYEASLFNQDIGCWDVSNVTDMGSMFRNAFVFDQDLGNWDVSSATMMNFMFMNAHNFNRDIGNWDVSSVTDMSFMFRGATAFNKYIGGWDVSSVTNMNSMFNDAHLFDQDISNWNVINVGLFSNFLNDAELSIENYNRLLIQWSQLDLQSGVVFHGGTSKYNTGEPADQRQYIIDEFAWAIIDGGMANIVQDPETFQLNIFPNPAKDKLTIESQKIIKYIQLIDIAGSVVKDKTVNDINCEMNVSQLPAGMYFIQVHTADELLSKKVQVRR